MLMAPFRNMYWHMVGKKKSAASFFLLGKGAWDRRMKEENEELGSCRYSCSQL